MRPGHLPTAVVGPVIEELVSERWPDEDGYQILAEKVGCDDSTIRAVVAQHNPGVGFDLVDGILACLGRPDLWEGRLADLYPETFWVTCALPGCGKRFPEFQRGKVKLYCSARCRSLGHEVRHGNANGMRYTQKSRCRKGLHRLTPDNILIRKGRVDRECRACARERHRAYQRRWKAARRVASAA